MNKLFRREVFLMTMLKMMGSPYVWNAKGDLFRVGMDGHGKPIMVPGFDCSGVYTAALYECSNRTIDRRRQWNTDKLWLELPMTAEPKPGDAVLYGSPGDPSHLMVWLGYADMVFGACGGGKQTTAPTKGAMVQPKSTFMYRPDFIGFRSISRYTGD